MSISSTRIRTGIAAVLLVAAAGLAGCASPAPAPTPTGDAYIVVPEPGRTITPTPAPTADSWRGMRVALITVGGADEPLNAGIREAALERDAEIVDCPAPTADDDGVAAALGCALDAGPDLVVGAGEPVVDVLNLESPQLLDQPFLIVGAQLAEPTANVTAVIWDGATSRGSAAAADGALDAAALTTETAAAATIAGVSSVRAGTTGVVLLVPSVEP